MSLVTSCDIMRHHAIGSGSGSGAGGVRCHSTEGVAEERQGGGSGSGRQAGVGSGSGRQAGVGSGSGRQAGVGSGSGRRAGVGSVRGSPYNHHSAFKHARLRVVCCKDNRAGAQGTPVTYYSQSLLTTEVATAFRCNKSLPLVIRVTEEIRVHHPSLKTRVGGLTYPPPPPSLEP